MPHRENLRFSVSCKLTIQYLNDYIISFRTLKEQLERLREVFHRFCVSNVKIIPPKYEVLKVFFLGHNVSTMVSPAWCRQKISGEISSGAPRCNQSEELHWILLSVSLLCEKRRYDCALSAQTGRQTQLAPVEHGSTAVVIDSEKPIEFDTNFGFPLHQVFSSSPRPAETQL